MRRAQIICACFWLFFSIVRAFVRVPGSTMNDALADTMGAKMSVLEFLERARTDSRGHIRDAANVLMTSMRPESLLPGATDSAFLLRPVHRVNNTISFEEFEAKFLAVESSVPVVVENVLGDRFQADQWTRNHLREECGHISAFVGHYNASNCVDLEDCSYIRMVNKSLIGVEWSGLQPANLTQFNISTVSELLDRQDTEEGRGLYLHDAPLSHYCPPAARRLQAPKYFPWDYMLLLNRDPGENFSAADVMSFTIDGPTWPTVFIGKKGSGSPLHSDAHGSRFYQIQLSGHKHWRLLPPSEAWRFQPNLEDYHYPSVFKGDAMKPNFAELPDMSGALVYETILNPGDLIYVPERWLHQVQNLDDTVSTSSNFVDKWCLPLYIKDVRRTEADDDKADRLEERYEFASSLLGDFHPLLGGHLEWEDYYRMHAFDQMPVPPDMLKNESTREHARSLLHIALRMNYVSVVKYFTLEHDVWPDMQVEETLQLVRGLGYDGLYWFLKAHEKNMTAALAGTVSSEKKTGEEEEEEDEEEEDEEDEDEAEEEEEHAAVPSNATGASQEDVTPTSKEEL